MSIKEKLYFKNFPRIEGFSLIFSLNVIEKQQGTAPVHQWDQ